MSSLSSKLSPSSTGNEFVPLNQLSVGSGGSVKVMICRSWDSINSYGKHIATEYIISDDKQFLLAQNSNFCCHKTAISGATLVKTVVMRLYQVFLMENIAPNFIHDILTFEESIELLDTIKQLEGTYQLLDLPSHTYYDDGRNESFICTKVRIHNHKQQVDCQSADKTHAGLHLTEEDMSGCIAVAEKNTARTAFKDVVQSTLDEE